MSQPPRQIAAPRHAGKPAEHLGLMKWLAKNRLFLAVWVVAGLSFVIAEARPWGFHCPVSDAERRAILDAKMGFVEAYGGAPGELWTCPPTKVSEDRIGFIEEFRRTPSAHHIPFFNIIASGTESDDLSRAWSRMQTPNGPNSMYSLFGPGVFKHEKKLLVFDIESQVRERPFRWLKVLLQWLVVGVVVGGLLHALRSLRRRSVSQPGQIGTGVKT